MIDLRRLQVLRGVAFHGTVTAAARALHLTPSAASQQVKTLERELGVTLLAPDGRRIRLTPAARSLLGHADAIDARWEQALAEVSQGEGEPAGVLRVGGITTAISALIAPAATTLRQSMPAASVCIRESEPPECFRLLFAGELDLVVAPVGAGNPARDDARFEQHPLTADPWDLLTDAGHRVAGRTEVDLRELSDDAWVASPPGTDCRETLMSSASNAGFTPLIAHELREWGAVATLVGRGMGVALIPRMASLPQHCTAVRTPLAARPRPSRSLLTVTRAGASEGVLVRAALEALERTAAALSA